MQQRAICQVMDGEVAIEIFIRQQPPQWIRRKNDFENQSEGRAVDKFGQSHRVVSWKRNWHIGKL